jgi:phospholipase C
MPTIFNQLTKKQRSWRIYYHDVAHAMLLSKIWSEVPDHLYDFGESFVRDAQTGALPSYSFIEPRYFTLPFSKLPNDQHPSHDVSLGDRLISKCYDALRRGPKWEKTLFIITYDEHGGMYDHVPPPAAVSPDGFQPDHFAFDRYGVRVPAIIVSPWIPPGSVIRPPVGSAYPFDHTSILATLRKLFALGQPLTARDAAAPDLLHALSLPGPTNSGPQSVALPSAAPTQAELAESLLAQPNGMQRALAEAAPTLPSGTAAIPGHVQQLSRLKAKPVSTPATVAEAREQAVQGVRRFVGGPWSMSIRDQ